MNSFQYCSPKRPKPIQHSLAKGPFHNWTFFFGHNPPNILDGNASKTPLFEKKSPKHLSQLFYNFSFFSISIIFFFVFFGLFLFEKKNNRKS